MTSTSPILDAACARLDAAVQRLDAALASRIDLGDAERRRLADALTAAESEQVALVEANRAAAQRIDQTIGRLRGLLAP